MPQPSSLEKPPPPFFIVGCTRSGTTLVSRILDSHSRIAVYHESHFYPVLRADLHRYGDLRHLPNLRRFISDVREVVRLQGRMEPPGENEVLEALEAPTFQGVLATMLQLYARRQGKILAGDKTPAHHAYLSEILEKSLEARVLFIIRDPRDTIVAIREKFGTSLNGAIWLWNDAFRSYQKFSRRVHLVRYEELVRRPEELVRDLCVYLGKGYEPEMLRFFERIPVWLARIPFNKDLLGPVDPRHIGSFRKMPARDIERIEAACAAGMDAMGYEFSRARPEALAIAPPTKLALLIDRLRFYRWNPIRWRRGWIRWKIVLRLRARYFVSFGWLRN
ncbi:MAG TPA: sulfotransferase [Candidatus Binatia bacterium]|jgi:hypothetical protein